MNHVEEALGMFAVNRQQEQRQRAVSSISIQAYRSGLGFCETCQCLKPAPKNRKKGWECDGCSKKANNTSVHIPLRGT